MHAAARAGYPGASPLIIQPTSLAALTWLGAAAGASAEGWRIGSVLSARPLGLSPQGLMVIQIGALTVEAEVPGQQSLPPQFQVRVLTLGAQPQLEVLGVSGMPEPSLNRALLERLPQQNGYAPLLATLDALAQRPVLRQLPPFLRTALAMLEHSIRTPAEISQPEGLREAIERSGLFLESRLAAAPDGASAAVGEDDWKGALLRLLSLLGTQPPPRDNTRAEADPPLQQRSLQPQPRAELPPALAASEDLDTLLPRLRGDVQAALARLEVAQLESAQAPASWLVEIPVQGTGGRDVLQVRLDYNAPAEEAPEDWTLGFALDLPALGPVQGELQLRGLRLAVRLWAQQASAVAALERQFGPLRQRLAASGLGLDQLTCQLGLPQAEGQRSAVFLEASA